MGPGFKSPRRLQVFPGWLSWHHDRLFRGSQSTSGATSAEALRHNSRPDRGAHLGRGLGVDRNGHIQGRHRSISQQLLQSGASRWCVGWRCQHRWNRVLLAWRPAAPNGAVLAVGLYSPGQSGGAGLGLDALTFNELACCLRRNRPASGRDRSAGDDGRRISRPRGPVDPWLLRLPRILGSRKGYQRGLARIHRNELASWARMRAIRTLAPVRAQLRTDGCAPSRARRRLRLISPRIPICFVRSVDPGLARVEAPGWPEADCLRLPWTSLLPARAAFIVASVNGLPSRQCAVVHRRTKK